MQIYTTTLSSGTIIINREDGAQTLCIQAKSGSQCILTGNFPFKGQLSTPITIVDGQAFNYAATNPSSPLDGIVITHVAGDIDIVVGL